MCLTTVYNYNRPYPWYITWCKIYLSNHNDPVKSGHTCQRRIIIIATTLALPLRRDLTVPPIFPAQEWLPHFSVLSFAKLSYMWFVHGCHFLVPIPETELVAQWDALGHPICPLHAGTRALFKLRHFQISQSFFLFRIQYSRKSQIFIHCDFEIAIHPSPPKKMLTRIFPFNANPAPP